MNEQKEYIEGLAICLMSTAIVCAANSGNIKLVSDLCHELGDKAMKSWASEIVRKKGHSMNLFDSSTCEAHRKLHDDCCNGCEDEPACELAVHVVHLLHATAGLSALEPKEAEKFYYERISQIFSPEGVPEDFDPQSEVFKKGLGSILRRLK